MGVSTAIAVQSQLVPKLVLVPQAKLPLEGQPCGTADGAWG